LIFEKDTVLLSFLVSDLGLSGDLRLTALCRLAQLCLRCGGEGRLCLERAMGLYKIWFVNIKIAGKWMFIPLNMVIGIDPYPYLCPNLSKLDILVDILHVCEKIKVLRCGKLWKDNINLCFKVTSASSNHSNSMIYPLLFI